MDVKKLYAILGNPNLTDDADVGVRFQAGDKPNDTVETYPIRKVQWSYKLNSIIIVVDRDARIVGKDEVNLDDEKSTV